MVDALFTEITGIVDFLITSLQLGVGVMVLCALPFVIMAVIAGPPLIVHNWIVNELPKYTERLNNYADRKAAEQD